MSEVERSGYKKFTVGVDITDPSTVANVQKYMRQLEQVAKNLSETGEAFVTATKQYQDRIVKDIYVKNTSAINAQRAFNHLRDTSGHLTNPKDPESGIVNPILVGATSDVEMVTLKKKVMGNARAIAAYRRYVAEYGGKMETLREEDMYQFTLPNIRTGAYKSGKPMTVRTGLADMINSDNNKEEFVRAEAERARSAREQERNDAKRDREEKKKINLDEREEKKRESLDSLRARKNNEDRQRTMRQIMTGWKPNLEDEKESSHYWKRVNESSQYGNKGEMRAAKNLLAGREWDDDGKKEGGKGQDPFKAIKSLTYYGTVVFLLKQIVDLTKAFFDGVRNSAATAARTSNESRALGIDMLTLTKYTRGEQMKGLAPGTVATGIQSIGEAFGDPTHLKDGPLAFVSMVMGKKVEDYVRLGINGPKDQADLYEGLVSSYTQMILNKSSKFGNFKTVQDTIPAAMAVAKNYGISDALMQVVLARVQDAINDKLSKSSQKAAREGTTLDWMYNEAGFAANPMGLNNADYAQAAAIDPLIKEIEALIGAIAAGFWVKIDPALSSFLVGFEYVIMQLVGLTNKGALAEYRNAAHQVGAEGVEGANHVIAGYNERSSDLRKVLFSEGFTKPRKDPTTGKVLPGFDYSGVGAVATAIDKYILTGDASVFSSGNMPTVMDNVSPEGFSRIIKLRELEVAKQKAKEERENYRKNSSGDNAVKLTQYNETLKTDAYDSIAAQQVLGEFDTSTTGTKIRAGFLGGMMLTMPMFALPLLGTMLGSTISDYRQKAGASNALNGVYGVPSLDRDVALQSATTGSVDEDVIRDTAYRLAMKVVNAGEKFIGESHSVVNGQINVDVNVMGTDGRVTTRHISVPIQQADSVGAQHARSLSNTTSSGNMSANGGR